MTEHLFFNKNQLKKCGKNVIIGKTVRIRYPELIEIGDNVIIDDFTYISTALKINSFVHIAPSCSLIGGKQTTIFIDSFSTLAPSCVLSAGSDDYIGGIATPLIPNQFKGNVEYGDIKIGSHVILGSHSVVLPNITLQNGSSSGAFTLINKNLDPWKLYIGIPCRFHKDRDKKNIKDLENQFRKSSN
jgi:acetyltransferase-like isoleucine patch superfamily enzyme